MKNWYTIKAVAGSDRAEVSILSEIGYWGVDAKQFLDEFRAIRAPNIDLYINSPGGSVFEAVAMFNGMRASGKHITVHVLGIAASAASYIAMVGDKVVMPANTMMFLHNPINAVYGNAEDMRDMADILDKIGASLTATYAKRFKGEASVLDELMAAESYLTAAECLEHGFCDEVTEEITATALFDVERLPEHVQALFKGQPAPVAAEPSTPFADTVAALVKARGLDAFLPVFLTDESATTVEAATAAIGAAAEVVALATHTGMSDRAEAVVRSRMSVADARKALATALAEVDAATHVDTAPPPVDTKGTTGGISASSLWAEIQELKAKGIRK